MAQVQTSAATVVRLVGLKGVAVEEVSTSRTGVEYTQRLTVWLGEGHGLNVGDKAKFSGLLSVKTREYNDKTYADVALSNGRYDPESLMYASDVLPPKSAPEGWGVEDDF
ncbi:hypothetical protein [Lysinibacter sp. HNR]|uniref:hypothetical protein n=1 Tax=Lysinibacter sp. HNR TaxID=3031408 RepID=UPI002434BCC3|nr:hypothetical protein [Lysinibacter sp. HNR]WGD38492.1 hypothetical protein FrondiHNR_06165 [Lysinibacter sp. HNR]